MHSKEAIKCKRQLVDFVEDVAKQAWNDSLKVDAAPKKPSEYADSISEWVDAKIAKIVKFANDKPQLPLSYRAVPRPSDLDTVEAKWARMFYAPRVPKKD